jgi:hypothetical protein
VTIGLERNSATQLIRRCAAISRRTPAHRAAPVVNAIAWAASVGPSAATSDPDSTDTVETGPTTSCRELPKIAYAIKAIGTVYRPSSTGTPAIAA